MNTSISYLLAASISLWHVATCGTPKDHEDVFPETSGRSASVMDFVWQASHGYFYQYHEVKAIIQGKDRDVSSGIGQTQQLVGEFQNDDTQSGGIIAPEPTPAWSGKLLIPGDLRVAVPAPEEERYAHLSWPKAIYTSDGTIVLAYLAGIFHGTHGGNSPAVSLSHDNGKTFTPPRILKAFSPDGDYTSSGNLAMGIAKDGAVVLLAMGYRGDEANHIFGWRSTDNGETWDDVNTSELGPNKTGSVCGTIVQLEGNKLMVMGHYRMPNRKHLGIWQSVSDDHGQTWSPPEMVTNIIGAEPVLIRAGDRLIVVIRGHGTASTRQYVAFSDDFGETWHTELSTISAQNYHTKSLAHPFAMLNPTQEKEILAVTVERPLPGSMWLWRGDTSSLGFKLDRHLMDIPKIEGNPHTDYGYAWMLHLGDNQYLMFYYHGKNRGANSIWVAEFNLNSN